MEISRKRSENESENGKTDFSFRRTSGFGNKKLKLLQEQKHHTMKKKQKEKQPTKRVGPTATK